MATNSYLNPDIGEATKLSCFRSDLLCQFSCWGDDDATDIVGPWTLAPGILLGEGRIALDDLLKNREKKTKGFARACPSLSNTGEGRN